MSQPFVLVFAAGTAEINRQIALKFAPRHPIAFLCPPQNNLGAVVSAAQDAGGNATLFETDLTAVDSIAASIASATAQLGKHCAAAIVQTSEEGGAREVPFLKQTTAQFRAATSSQISGVYAFAQAVLPLLTYGGGSAEFPATLAFVGPVGGGASRCGRILEGALVALSRSLGREYGKKYIHVTHVKFAKEHVADGGKLENENRDERVADTLWYLYTQPFSCFANEITI
ncbi:hypothetical protein NLG97_g2271 [Lecanicillium saksenae]|uniref:Uncharacterized protein n=1 Tax=Lecanicillium saksenae TaxID=468837 RepID=A0ACC1R5F4_9HYPO|nr:hypothetical protein NLG97_g2271 [Lecanicillium saksenae]